MSTLFFVINQDPTDGSAHGLYCLRNCWWLAAVRGQATVRLVHPGRMSDRDALRRVGLSSLPNLHLHALPSIRKPRGGRGITVNALYYWALVFFLDRRKQPRDILASAGFPRLMRFLYRRKGQTSDLRRVYEVHQLAVAERGPQSREARVEAEVLARSDRLLTTTGSLQTLLERIVPDKSVHNLGLACGFDPENFPMRTTDPSRPFSLGYIGSLYPEQGVEWLVRSWTDISRQVDLPLRLVVAGGVSREVQRLRLLVQERQVPIHIHGPVQPRDLPSFLENVDALVIPALPEGRMPYVALTKAYDYLGLNRPILAADLPSVAEVLRRNKEAVLFAPANAGALAAAIARVAHDKDLARVLLANCRKRRRLFSWENRSRLWWEAVIR